MAQNNNVGDGGQCSSRLTTNRVSQMEDLFVDANETLEGAEPAARVGAEGASAAGARDELKVRLEETAVVLRMALNNEFKRALDICGQK